MSEENEGRREGWRKGERVGRRKEGWRKEGGMEEGRKEGGREEEREREGGAYRRSWRRREGFTHVLLCPAVTTKAVNSVATNSEDRHESKSELIDLCGRKVRREREK